MSDPIVVPTDSDRQRDEAKRYLADIVYLLAVARQADLPRVVEALEAAMAEAQRLLAECGDQRLDS